MQDDSELRSALSRMERNAKQAGREQLQLGLRRRRAKKATGGNGTGRDRAMTRLITDVSSVK